MLYITRMRKSLDKYKGKEKRQYILEGHEFITRKYLPEERSAFIYKYNNNQHRDIWSCPGL